MNEISYSETLLPGDVLICVHKSIDKSFLSTVLTLLTVQQHSFVSRHVEAVLLFTISNIKVNGTLRQFLQVGLFPRIVS